MKSCCICQAPITVEEPPILIMSAYGEPRCLCEDCSAELDTVTLGKELDAIAAAMDGIGKKMSESDPDKLTFNTVNKIMQKGAERAKAIREGSYDFALDGGEEENGEGFDEIPEELAETEPYLGFASAEGLSANPDNLHFNAPSLYEFGRRYYSVFRALENKDKVFEEKGSTADALRVRAIERL